MLRNLLQARERFDRDTLDLLLTYDADRSCVALDAPRGPWDGALYLGNKGYMIKRLAHDGLPVPRGFILTTEIFRCREAIRACESLERELADEIRRNVRRLEHLCGARFGDPRNPLLLAVRSGAAISMPGSLDTFLNVGINQEIAQGFAERSGSAWAAWDAYRRFLQFWGMGAGLDRNLFDGLMYEAKLETGVAKKSHLPAEKMRALALRYREFLLDRRIEVPDDPYEQLRACVELVLRSWDAEKARFLRRELQIADEWGTAVIVQSMVYGNLHGRSGTGVVLTRDPRRSSGDLQLYGDFVVQGQGDDVVSGLVETFAITKEQRLAESKTSSLSLEKDFPSIYQAMLAHAHTLIDEHGLFHQELEFTFESDKPEDLYILQTRDTVLAPVTELPAFVPTPELAAARLTTGIGAGGGALSGRLAHGAAEIEELRRRWPEDPVILARRDTVPEDIPLILQADGLVTALGGATSHAALVAQRLGRTCVVGCRQLEVNQEAMCSELAGRKVKTGEFVSIDGRDGSVYLGRHKSQMVHRHSMA